MTTFRFDDDDPENTDTGPDYFLRHPGREQRQAYSRPEPELDFGPEPEPRRGSGKWRRRFAMLLLMAVGVLAGIAYVRYFVPHTTGSIVRGRLTSIERRGIIFPITEVTLTDTEGTTRSFSVPDDSIASLLAPALSDSTTVTITTDSYFAPLPWRGQSSSIITSVKP